MVHLRAYLIEKEDLSHPTGSSEEIREGVIPLPCPEVLVSLSHCHFCFYFFSSQLWSCSSR